jgi:hypothetical protein
MSSSPKLSFYFEVSWPEIYILYYFSVYASGPDYPIFLDLITLTMKLFIMQPSQQPCDFILLHPNILVHTPFPDIFSTCSFSLTKVKFHIHVTLHVRFEYDIKEVMHCLK